MSGRGWELTGGAASAEPPRYQPEPCARSLTCQRMQGLPQQLVGHKLRVAGGWHPAVGGVGRRAGVTAYQWVSEARSRPVQCARGAPAHLQ